MNAYSTMIARLATTLQAEMAALGWTPLDVRYGIWKPRALLEFDRYLIFIAPPPSNPWTEVREAVRASAYILRAEIFLLVKNYNEEQSVFGDTAPNLGVFQMIEDVKAVLRATDLDGLVDRTLDETVGGSAFESGASGGFESGEASFVHRAKLLYTARMHPFCVPHSND